MKKALAPRIPGIRQPSFRRPLMLLVVLSSISGPTQPVTTTSCENGRRIAALEFSIGEYHVSTAAIRCDSQPSPMGDQTDWTD